MVLCQIVEGRFGCFWADFFVDCAKALITGIARQRTSIIRILDLPTVTIRKQKILSWLEQGQQKPEKVYVTDREMVASDLIVEELGCEAEVPELFDEVGA